MKVLLVGNLAEDRQESMRRFAELLESGLRSQGHQATLIAPALRLARLIKPYRYSGLPKYLGYVDKFVLFPRTLRRQIAESRPDVVHIIDHANAVYLPSTRNAPTLVTCHDLLQVRAAQGEFPQQPVGRFGRRYQAWILRGLSHAPHIACVSAKTQADVSRLTGLPAERIAVVPNALNYPYRRVAEAEARDRFASLVAATGENARRIVSNASGFLLHVGAAHWYKNRPGLLAIYAELRRHLAPPPALILVGPPLSSAEAAQAAALGLTEHLVLFAAVSNEQLEALYRLAGGLIFPSWEEGFGWPIAEAQTCGCPVFTTNRAPMTEVGGTSAVYFDPENPSQAARTIAASWPRRGELSAKGLEEAQRWKPVAMLSAYESIYRKLAANAPGVKTAS